MPVTLRFQSTGLLPGNARPAVVTGGSLTIGRAEVNDLILPDPDRQISKQHCVIEERGSEVVVIDFSANGTFLNYSKLPLGRQPTALSDGDILTMGAFELLVSITPGAGPARAPAGSGDPLSLPPAPGPDYGGTPGGDFALLPPLEEGPGLAAPSGHSLPAASEEVDFLDSLLGASGPKGHKSLNRPELGDDGTLPALGLGEPALALPESASEAASLYEHQEGMRDHFAAPPASTTIPDDWDALFDDLAPPAAPAATPVAAPAPEEMPLPEDLPPALTLAQTADPFREEGEEEMGVDVSGDSGEPAPAPPPPLADEAVAVADEAESAPISAPVPAADPLALAEGVAPRAEAVIPAEGARNSNSLGAFLTALGAADLQIPAGEEEATMARLGRAMRSMITGLRDVLMTRASIKQEFRIGQTVIAAGGNNPLKFSISPEQAIEAMVRPTAKGWLAADIAADQALQDLKAHEVAMLTGMEAALKDLLKRLDPAVLETKLDAKGGISGFLKGKKARYWELYEGLYAEIADQAENEFQELFAREFARAYRAQLERLK